MDQSSYHSAAYLDRNAYIHWPQLGVARGGGRNAVGARVPHQRHACLLRQIGACMKYELKAPFSTDAHRILRVETPAAEPFSD